MSAVTIGRTAALGLLLAFVAAMRAEAADPRDTALEGWLAELERALPREARAFSPEANERLAKAAAAIEQWGALAAWVEKANSTQTLTSVRRLLSAKSRVDRLLDATLESRRQFAALDRDSLERDALRAYLTTTSQLIDLSGRLRYLQVDLLNAALPRLSRQPGDFARLLDLLIAERSTVGAYLLSQQLLQPASPQQPAPQQPAPQQPPQQPETARERRTLRQRITANRPVVSEPNPGVSEKLLELARVAPDTALLPQLADALDDGRLSPGMTIAVAETIRRIGLPQEPRPGTTDENEIPPITPRELYDHVSRVPEARISAAWRGRRRELLAWLGKIAREGITEGRYRIGSFEVQPGDWLLMRNPSPYNLFTDLSPGLFTHVGVVALERGSDGIRRMVLVDLPERGSSIPATNVETYVMRTLHYCFLRHPEPKVAAAMGQAAAEVIGNESQFDLNFRTDRVAALAEGSLKGKKVHTYCAGLLLLCALKSQAPRADFFPIAEFPAGGRTTANLSQLGLSIGDNFISPTGAIFSQKLELVGRREPMYDPRREVEEAIFDRFAQLLATQTLAPSPNLFQALRLKMAEAAKENSLLAQALAKAAQVNAETDLVSAAKAAAVVETLDEIAYSCSGDCLDARDSLRAGPLEAMSAAGYDAQDIAAAKAYRQRHADLYDKLRQNAITPRRLRIGLVDYYIALGKKELERRFFRQADAEENSATAEQQKLPADAEGSN